MRENSHGSPLQATMKATPSSSDASPTGHHVSAIHKKKKKKKKKQQNGNEKRNEMDISPPTMMETPVMEKAVEKKKRKKGSKKVRLSTAAEGLCNEALDGRGDQVASVADTEPPSSTETHAQDTASKHKHKKKKKKKQDEEAEAAEQIKECCKQAGGEVCGKNEKRKKKRACVDAASGTEEGVPKESPVDAMASGGEPCSVKKAKKRKLDKATCPLTVDAMATYDCATTSQQPDGSSIMLTNTRSDTANGHQKKRKKKGKSQDVGEEVISEKDALADEEIRKKKKNRKDRETTMANIRCASDGEADGEEVTDDRKSTTKKKKKKKMKDEENTIDDDTHQGSGDVREVPAKKLKKKVKKDKQMIEAVEDRMGISHDHVNETENSSAKLQSPSSGQWATAEFNDIQKKDKFLRLLGGFKKPGNPAGKSVTDCGNSAGEGAAKQKPFLQKFNMALTQKQQSTLEEGLEQQFERARGFMLQSQKGGLGYEAPPEEGKTFYIDRTGTKSTKFDN